MLGRMGDSPGCVAIPDVAESSANALLSGEAGHHCFCQLHLDLLVESIQKSVFIFEVSKQRSFGYARKVGDCGGGSA